MPRVPFSLDGITLQIFYIFNRENIESSSKSEFEFGALSSRVDISFSSFLDVEGGRASVINDSSRIIYRPLIRGWIKASAIKLQNVRAALPPLSLSLYSPPSSTPLREITRTGRIDGVEWDFQGWRRNYRGRYYLHLIGARVSFSRRYRGGGVRGGQERERVIYYISRGVGRDANFQARELAGSERRGTTLFPVVLRLFVALLAARKATAFLNASPSLALRLTPANAARWTGARTIARASLIIAVALPCRGGSQPSFSSTRGLIELKTRRGENSKIYMDVDMDTPTQRFLFRFYAKFWNV